MLTVLSLSDLLFRGGPQTN